MASSRAVVEEQGITVWDVLRIAKRRFWLIALLMVVSVGTAVVLSARSPKRWRGTAQMILIQRAPASAVSPNTAYTPPVVETPETQVAMLQSYGMARRTIDWLKNRALSAGSAVEVAQVTPDELQRSIAVTCPRDTNLLTVEVEASSRSDAGTLADAVCQAFVGWKRDVAQQSTQDTTSTLEVRARRARQQMVEAERREMRFKQKNGLVDVPVQQRAAVDHYLAREAEVATLGQELASQKARLAGLGRQLADSNAAIRASMGVRDDALVVQLQAQLTQLEMDRQAAGLKYTKDYPGVLPDLDARILDARTRLANAIKGTLDNKKPSLQAQGTLVADYKQAQVANAFARARYFAAIRQRDTMKGQLRGVPAAGIVYARLARNTDMSRQLYTSLQSALSAVRLDKDMASGNVQVSELASVPERPAKPNLLLDSLVGVAVGLFLSLFSILVLEHSDRRVRSSDELRRLVSGTVIGALPSMSRDEVTRMLANDPTSPAAMAYARARTNLALGLRSDERSDPLSGKVILVASAMPEEGKSLSALGIARAIAKAGKSVILVDGDMRRPSMNRLLKTDEVFGVADVLRGWMTVDQVIVGDDQPNLFVIHSGTTTGDPAELLALPETGAFIRQLRREADVVVVDAPASAVVPDALILAQHVDAAMYVLAAGQVERHLVRETVEALAGAVAGPMFYFVNRAPRERRHAYAYSYQRLKPDARESARRENDRPARPTKVRGWIGPAQTSDDDTASSV